MCIVQLESTLASVDCVDESVADNVRGPLQTLVQRFAAIVVDADKARMTMADNGNPRRWPSLQRGEPLDGTEAADVFGAIGMHELIFYYIVWAVFIKWFFRIIQLSLHWTFKLYCFIKTY